MYTTKDCTYGDSAEGPGVEIGALCFIQSTVVQSTRDPNAHHSQRFFVTALRLNSVARLVF